MDTHYICTGGCGGVAAQPGVCQSLTCEKHNQPLTECHCKDGLHKQEQSETRPKEDTHKQD